MGAGAVSGHSATPGNQVFPSTSASTSAPANGTHSRPNLGDVAFWPSSAPTSQGQSSSSADRSIMPNKVLSCETCDNNFTFFKRKKVCRDCQRWFCSSCLPKPPSTQRQTGRQCAKCTILTSGRFTRQQLLAWRVKDMRCFLDARNIPTDTCKEKHDLIDLVLFHFCLESNSMLGQRAEHDRLVQQLADRMRDSSFYSTPTLPHQVLDSEESSPSRDLDPEVSQSHDPAANQSQSSPASQSSHGHPQDDTETRPSIPVTTETEGDNSEIFLMDRLRQRQLREMREAMRLLENDLDQDEPETRPGIERANIDDLQTAEAAESLTVKQLKEILVNNFVDYRGCCEKHELVDRVKRLWQETHTNRQRVLEVTEDSGDPSQEPTQQKTQSQDPEQDICKICMDSVIDCILLECGHMITCSKCGKRLADCPICRQYVQRVVHVFRS